MDIKNNSSEIWMHPTECARLLRVNYWTIIRHIKAGKIKAIRVGRHYKVSRGVFEEYVKQLGYEVEVTGAKQIE